MTWLNRTPDAYQAQLQAEYTLQTPKHTLNKHLNQEGCETNGNIGEDD